MNCDQAQNLFDAYLDGELSGSLAAELGAHQLNCGVCRRELALLEVAGHVIAADVDAPSLDEEFTNRLLACAARDSRAWYRPRRWMLYAGPALAAAACLAVMFVPLAQQGSVPVDGELPAGVARYRDDIGSAEELLNKIQRAQDHNRADPRLQEMAGLLRAMIEETSDGANLLEKYGRETIIEILESIPIDAPAGQPVAAPSPEAPKKSHGSTVEDL
jgi:hypothetical protein